MKKIISLTTLIIILLFIAIFTAYIMDNDGHLNQKDTTFFGFNQTENKTTLTVSSEGPINLSILIDEIKNNKYYEGYDKDTVIWMESLKQKEVFRSNDSYVIMNKNDASKLNTEYVADAYIEEYLDCIIIENRSLGGNTHKDILVVKDVEYLGNNTHYFDV